MNKLNLPTKVMRTYITGFVLSILLTLATYVLVVKQVFSVRGLLIWVGALAVVQFIVQLVFFLHLGREPKPRWNFMVFIFAIGVVVILVFGSLWIMVSLDYFHGQSERPAGLEKSIIEDEGFEP